MRRDKNRCVCQARRSYPLLMRICLLMILGVFVTCAYGQQGVAEKKTAQQVSPAGGSAKQEQAVKKEQPLTNQDIPVDSFTARRSAISSNGGGGGALPAGYLMVSDPQFQEIELKSRELEYKSKELDYRAKELNFQIKENYLRSLLSSQGRVLFDTEQNSITVIDFPENVKIIEEYLEEIDVPANQVLIEARIVEVSLEGEHSLGVNWNLFSGERGLSLGAYRLYSSDAVVPGLEHTHSGIAQSIAYKNTFYPPNQTTSGSEEPFTFTIFDDDLLVVLKMLSNRLKTTVLSAPSITTVNNRKADIRIISQLRWVVPTMSVGDSGGTTLAWTEGTGSPQEVGIILDVTPRITDDGQVAMELHPEISEQTNSLELQAISGGTTVDYAIPIIDKRSANTKVIVGDGQTLIIGGLIKNNATKGESKVPWFADLPVFGHLFRSKKDTKLKSELLIFVSPKIISPKDLRSMKAAKDKISKDTIGRSVFNIETQKPVIDSIYAGDNVKTVIKDQEEKEAAQAESRSSSRSSKAVSPRGISSRPATSSGVYRSVPADSNYPLREPLQRERIAVIVEGEGMREKEVKRLLNLFDN